MYPRQFAGASLINCVTRLCGVSLLQLVNPSLAARLSSWLKTWNLGSAPPSPSHLTDKFLAPAALVLNTVMLVSAGIAELSVYQHRI